MTHDVLLRAPHFLGGGTAPAVLRLLDQRFIPTLFDDLRDPERRAALVDKVLPADDPTLYLPAHRTFNVVIAEAVCDIPGKPRVDPTRIDSAGVVVRRRVPKLEEDGAPTDAKSGPQRWVAEDQTVLGWQPAVQPDLDVDPEAERRPLLLAGNAAVDAALARQRPTQPQVSEASTKLFPVPPDICDAAGATLYFAVIEPASPETAEQPPVGDDPSLPDGPATYADDEIRMMLPAWLRPAQTTPKTVPSELAGKTFWVENDSDGADELDLVVKVREGDGPTSTYDVPNPWAFSSDEGSTDTEIGGESLTDAKYFVRMLSQLQLQWAVWEGKDPSLSNTLRGITAELPDGTSTDLDDLLKRAAQVLILREEGVTVTIPEEWPLIPSETAAVVQDGVKRAAEARLASYIRHEGRYERPDALYHIRAFARVQGHPECPPDLVWSGNTGEYRVARWFEGAPEGAIMPTIEMPSIDRGFLKSLRPNVTMKVPRELFNFLQNNVPEDMLQGKVKNNAGGPLFDWICGFNISIIFVIAFMLLITFVLLLNIAFWWIAFFRICIPLPRGN